MSANLSQQMLKQERRWMEVSAKLEKQDENDRNVSRHFFCIDSTRFYEYKPLAKQQMLEQERRWMEMSAKLEKQDENYKNVSKPICLHIIYICLSLHTIL